MPVVSVVGLLVGEGARAKRDVEATRDRAESGAANAEDPFEDGCASGFSEEEEAAAGVSKRGERGCFGMRIGDYGVGDENGVSVREGGAEFASIFERDNVVASGREGRDEWVQCIAGEAVLVAEIDDDCFLIRRSWLFKSTRARELV